MDDLISRAATHEMVKGLQKWCIRLPGNPRITQVGYMSDDVRFGLDRLPAVDAVPVIRCRDCKYYMEHNDRQGGNCNHLDYDGEYEFSVAGDWFCADGERGDDNGADA